MINDSISDMLTRIRNANLIKSRYVSIPFSRINHELTKILEKEGFIKSFQLFDNDIRLLLKYIGREKKSCITNLRRISKPGLRIYANHKEIPKILGGMGIVILSTPQGLMTDREARFRKVGGEILCSIW
uniref:Small ribosomal subunit protein uS8c n=1 Tax=Scotinosphaera sp. NIES-154 TaxID=2249731 RepID=A0A2Z4MAS8_9CHLO|nr:ribosomal protein S8 [Scotinosphaera sp. NIES-154]